jgi:uncharacterized protein (TIGR03083 family)
MNLWDAPVEDVRPLLAEERRDLLALLASLTPHEWSAATAAPAWSVKDLALHLLDDDLGWLSRGRDLDRSGLLDMSDHSTFVQALAAKNQAWVDGAHGLSKRVVIDLLEWSGQQMDSYYASMDLGADGWVSWASDGPVPVWFDVAQDLTERWVHQQQMREAIGRVADYAEKYLPSVLRTFVWAVPHQYRVAAEAGTVVAIDLGSGGSWSITRTVDERWTLDEGSATTASARVQANEDLAWRWFTGAAVERGAIAMQGSPALVEPLLDVRAIIV